MKSKNNKTNPAFDLIDENAVVSTTEYTGLVQIPPQNNYEANSYSEIYKNPEKIVEKKKG